MSVKGLLKKDLLMIAARVNGERKEAGKEPLNVKFKGSEIVINKEGSTEEKAVKMDLDLILYKLVNGEGAFEFFTSFLKRFDLLYSMETMNWQTYRHFVYPILKDHGDKDFFDPNSGMKLITQESNIPFTKVFFVIDDEHQMMYVSNKMIEELGITEEELIQEAYQNLKGKYDFDLIEGEFSGIHSFKSDTRDGFDVTRILNMDLSKLTEKIGDNYYVVMPERDMLLIVEGKQAENQKVEGLLSSYALREYNNSRYGVSPKLYQWNGTQLVVVK